MSDVGDARRINVTARDQAGQLLPGTSFTFEVDGEPHGSVTDSDGRGDITLPADETGALKVTASYKGQTKSEVLDLSQSAFTFIFKGSAAVPQISRRTVMILTFLFAIILVGLIVMYAFRPNQPSSETERAASEIARNCAGGRQIVNEEKITAGLSSYLTRVSTEGSVKSSDVGTVTMRITSDETGLKFYQAYTRCLKDQTQSWLQLRGIKVETSGDDPSQPAGAPLTSLGEGQGTVAAGGLSGWSYYEEYDGKPTEDGVLMPPGADRLLRYGELKKGTVLKSLHGFKIRKRPTGSSEVIENAGAAECVKMLSPPAHPVQVSKATSGGYLEVAIVPCRA
ncbi:MAG TPA: Ig-like domain-containing protein [Sphingomicrobium sp.]|nr:Ig-like domain-containing protein [Sphingomicrobium sp.]